MLPFYNRKVENKLNLLGVAFMLTPFLESKSSKICSINVSMLVLETPFCYLSYYKCHIIGLTSLFLVRLLPDNDLFSNNADI